MQLIIKISHFIKIACFMIWGVFINSSMCLFAQTSVSEIEASEYQIKAAYLYNFMKFVEWPDDVFENANSPVVLGILGEDPFGSDIDDILAGKMIQNRNIIIKRLTKQDELQQCHLLFISQSEKKYLSDILQSQIKNLPVLTIGDIPGFADSGGMIQLISKDNKIHFLININSLNAASINMSSRLLKLADIVNE